MFDIAVNIRDADGNLILALEDDANGYYIRGEGLPAEEILPIVRKTRSPFVDGSSVDGSTLEEVEVSLLVKVFGSTWPQAVARHLALEEAVRTAGNLWILEEVVEGVTTTRSCGPIRLLTPPVSTMDLLNKRRFVVLTFDAQPTKTVSGV
jgi:hypothetical protein